MVRVGTVKMVKMIRMVENGEFCDGDGLMVMVMAEKRIYKIISTIFVRKGNNKSTNNTS